MVFADFVPHSCTAPDQAFSSIHNTINTTSIVPLPINGINHQMDYAMLLLAILLLHTVVQATEMSTLLANNPELFKPCETNICFVFNSQKPITNLDPKMRREEHQKLFRCRERARVFPLLSGPFFDLVDAIPELQKASCIWAGPNSTYDSMVQFVGRVSRGNRTLKFISGGLLFQMAYRISNGTIPSVSVTSGKVVVVSINRPAEKAVSDAAKAIVGPFGQGTWWLLSGIILLFAAVYVLITYCFLINYSCKSVCNAMLEPFIPMHWLRRHRIGDVASDNDSKESRAYLIRMWKRSMLLFLVISALFWEIGVVNFVTNDQPYVLPFVLNGMKRDTLERFIVSKDSAFETMLQDLALPNTITHNERLWKTAGTFDEIFDSLSETKNGKPRYTLSTDRITLYELHNRGLCSKLAVHDSSDPLPDYSSVWYYSSHISQNMRSILDARISRLREEGRIKKFIENSTGKVTLTCGLTSYSISIFVLLVPLGLVLCPFLLFILTALFVCWILQQRDRKKIDEKSAPNTKSTEDDDIENPVSSTVGEVSNRSNYKCVT